MHTLKELGNFGWFAIALQRRCSKEFAQKPLKALPNNRETCRPTLMTFTTGNRHVTITNGLFNALVHFTARIPILCKISPLPIELINIGFPTLLCFTTVFLADIIPRVDIGVICRLLIATEHIWHQTLNCGPIFFDPIKVHVIIACHATRRCADFFYLLECLFRRCSDLRIQALTICKNSAIKSSPCLNSTVNIPRRKTSIAAELFKLQGKCQKKLADHYVPYILGMTYRLA